MPRKSKSKKLKLSSDSSTENDRAPNTIQKMDIDDNDSKADVKSSKSSVDKNSQQDTANNQNSNNLNQLTQSDENLRPTALQLAPDDGLLDLSLKK